MEARPTVAWRELPNVLERVLGGSTNETRKVRLGFCQSDPGDFTSKDKSTWRDLTQQVHFDLKYSKIILDNTARTRCDGNKRRSWPQENLLPWRILLQLDQTLCSISLGKQRLDESIG